MLEPVIGPKRNLLGVDELISRLRDQPWTGTLYVGYPVIALYEEPTTIDVLLTCREHGVVVFDLHDGKTPTSTDAIRNRQDDLHAALYRTMLGYKPLVENRRLAVEISIVTVIPPDTAVEHDAHDDDGILVSTAEDVIDLVATLPPISADTLAKVNASIQRMGTIKHPARRTSLSRDDSRGAVMHRIEQEIANLDQWQKAAAIETPDGPQRIRGLAGSGKTVVLALKAAYLHARNPDWRIALTFHTRSLYQQLQDLVRRFYYAQTQTDPNWDNLRIAHAWGSSDRPGIYSETAHRAGMTPRDFSYGKTHFYEKAFAGVCTELVAQLEQRPSEPVYDVLLIDEAQDLPQSFFELSHLITKEPKRIVWAYDELQNLSAYMMAPPSTLFGKRKNGRPRVPEFEDKPGAPRQDIILPVCYRNTPWALTIAHALGFGIYRDGGLVQFFDDPALWKDIGYDTLAGEIAPGQEVTLARSPSAAPAYFSELLDPGDAVVCKVFEDVDKQAEWVASSIRDNTTKDELLLSDILVVMASPYGGEKDVGAARLAQQLRKMNINVHLAGVTTSVDSLFLESSIAISNVYRAKGNEAPMVYVINSEHGVQPSELIKRRNALFTAITRSRAWVRVCGCGPRMTEIKEEIDRCVEENYHLAFRVPTPEELQRLRRIHRDRTPDEKAKIKKASEGLAALVELAERGDNVLETLPRDAREQLLKLLREANDVES